MTTTFLPFKISSGLKNIIGRDLITDDFVAVFELVKNAYDARAGNVVIEFLPNKIVIEDDGKGMSKEDIANKWLFVAYSAKKEGTEDETPIDYRDNLQLKRYYAGAKGIGRFSCDKLGNKLILTTRKFDNNSTEQITVNWSEFDQDASKEFLEIKVKHETLSKEYKFLDKSLSGTKLEIVDLNEKWSRDKKKALKKSLEKLINPFDSENEKYLENTTQSFSISIKDKTELEADNSAKNSYDKVNGKIQNFIFEKLNLKTSHIKVTIDEMGEAFTIKLIDRGTLIYTIRKKNTTPLKNVIFHLFYLNQSAKSNFTRSIGTQPVNFGTIFLYKNGFRIAPFGDPGEDSFGIDRRHGQKTGETFGLRDLIGRIEIFGDANHEQFRETTSRNGGFIKNMYTESLNEFIIEYCLKRLEAYIFGIARKTTDSKIDRLQEDTSHLENIKSQNEIFKLIRREVEKGKGELIDLDKDFMKIRGEALKEATKEAIENLKFLAEQYKEKSFLQYANETSVEFERIQAENEELQKRLKEEEEERRKAEEERHRAEEERRRAEYELKLEQEKNLYLLATRRVMSKDADGLIHNIKFMSNKIRAIVDNLVDEIQNGNASTKHIIQHLGSIRIFADKALKISELITRANFKTNVQTQVVDVVKFTEQYFSLFNDIYEKDQMNFEFISNNASLEKRIGVLDLSMVFDNFIFNAEKAHASLLLVECNNPTQTSLSIRISDNGAGVDDKFVENPEKMFELGVTTTDGSGIGLYSIRENLRNLGAKVSFLGNNQHLKGATFEIHFS